jgi:hypothetical protein
MADTIIRVVYDNVTYDLDIDSSVPLRLDVSAVESGRIGSFFGVGSQTFNLPGTKVNNRFFKHAYDIGNQDIPAFFNSIPGYIISDGETLVQGQFQLMEVITDSDGYVDYKCQMSDDVVRFKDNIATKYVRDADWSAFEHTINSGSIIDSWNDTLFSGSIFYPLAEYGISDPSNATLPKFGFGPPGSTVGNYVNNPSTPITPEMFLPAVRVRDVIDVLFDQVNYRATGSFIETDDFKQLYILPKGQEQLGIVADPAQTGTMSVIKEAGQTIQEGTLTTLSFNTILSDPLGRMTTGNPTYYTATDNGTFNFEGGCVVNNPTVFLGGEVELTVNLKIGSISGGVSSGTIIDSFTKTLTSADGMFITTEVGGVYTSTTPSNEIWIEIRLDDNGSGFVSTDVWGGYTSYFRCTSAPVNYSNATVNMGLQFESETRSIDIIQGLIEQFNLVLTPVYGETNIIQIETFDRWMLDGRTVDWTDKFNQAQRVGISHTVDEVERELKFKHKDTADRFAKLTIENAPEDQYGTLRVLADNNISQGKKTVGDYFGPVILASPFEYDSFDQDGNFTFNLELSNRTVVPHLYKFENNNTKTFQFTPRLGYKVTNDFASGDYVYVGYNGENPMQVSGSYATLSNTSRLPVTTGVSNDLNFNTSYGLFTAAGLNLNNGVSAYNKYWKTYIESLYWEENRKVTLDVEFTPQEYKDIRLNDHIFIKNQQYRINKISGYNVTDDDVVKVELVRLYPAYYTPVVEIDCDFDLTAAYTSSNCADPYTSYAVFQCTNPINTTFINYEGTLNNGDVVYIFGDCYEVGSEEPYDPIYNVYTGTVYADCSTCAGAPTPTPTPTPAPSPPLTDGWAFTAGTTTVANVVFNGFHRGTLFGCPSPIGYGTGASPTTTTTNLPGTDCYDLSNLLVTKGYGIDGTGTASTLALTQFSTDTSQGTTYMAFINNSGIGNPGSGTLSGTIQGSDGNSGTWSVNYNTLSAYVDNNGQGTIQQPESGGFVTLNGLTLTNGVTYSLEI